MDKLSVDSLVPGVLAIAAVMVRVIQARKPGE